MPLTPAESAELGLLLPLARASRRQHSPGSPQRRASERVTEILAGAHAEERATVRELASATGLSYHSVARRERIGTGSPTVRGPGARGTGLPSARAVPGAAP